MQMIKEKELEIKEKYQSRDVIIQGVKCGSLSPYDVPLKAKATYDESKKLLSIEFTYLTPNEPTQPLKFENGEINLHVGETSGKLYGVEIHCPSKEYLPKIRVKVSLTLDKLIAESEKKPISPIQHENLSATKDFLSREPELTHFIEELATA